MRIALNALYGLVVIGAAVGNGVLWARYVDSPLSFAGSFSVGAVIGFAAVILYAPFQRLITRIAK